MCKIIQIVLYCDVSNRSSGIKIAVNFILYSVFTCIAEEIINMFPLSYNYIFLGIFPRFNAPNTNKYKHTQERRVKPFDTTVDSWCIV